MGNYKAGQNYFSDPRDIPLGISADGVVIWKEKKKGNPSCWPLLVLNYALSPEIRNRLEYLVCLGVIPGPKQPKDIASFLIPFIDECIDLLKGVRTFDALRQEIFDLRAFLIAVFGDMPAIAKLLGIKGHNGIRPCRCCMIRGILGPRVGGKATYYYPLEHPHTCNEIEAWDPADLPMRTHESFAEAISAISRQTTQDG